MWAFKVLQAAERHNLTVVEDDIFLRSPSEDDASARRRSTSSTE